VELSWGGYVGYVERDGEGSDGGRKEWARRDDLAAVEICNLCHVLDFIHYLSDPAVRMSLVPFREILRISEGGDEACSCQGTSACDLVYSSCQPG
jgi:hypothetical protein